MGDEGVAAVDVSCFLAALAIRGLPLGISLALWTKNIAYFYSN
jgi:hypothetical protein